MTSVASIRENTITGNVTFGVFVDADSLVSGWGNEISGNGTDTSDSVPDDLVNPR